MAETTTPNGVIDFLKDSSGSFLYPITLVDSIYDLNGNTLDTILDGKVSKAGDTMTGDLTISKVAPLLTIKASDSNDTGLVFDRGGNANIKFLNSAGVLKIQGDWLDSAKQAEYHDLVTIAGGAGNMVVTGTVTAPTFIGALTGTASQATKVYGTATNPASTTVYGVPFHSTTGNGYKSLLTNDGLRYYTYEGTTSAVGRGTIVLGNATAKETAGNKRGQIQLYGDYDKYVILAFTGTTSDTSNYTLYLPGQNGTLLSTAGGTMAGTLNMKNVTLNDGHHNRTCMQAFCEADDGSTNNGADLTLGAGGNTFLGSGESCTALRTALRAGVSSGEEYNKTSENMYISADNSIMLYSNCNTVKNRVGIIYDASGNLRPMVANTRALGTTTYPWNAGCIKALNVTTTYQQGGVTGKIVSVTSSAPSNKSMLWAY